MRWSDLSDKELHDYVVHYQNIQKRHPPTSPEWRYASREIHAACAENARRHQGGMP
jgi:hypothetical protein